MNLQSQFLGARPRWLIAAILLAISMEGRSVDAPKLLDKFDEIISVSLTVGPHKMQYRRRQTIADLKAHGCTYLTNDAKLIVNILAIMKDADLTQNIERTEDVDVRESLTLRLRNGDESTILLSDNVNDGRVSQAALDGMPITIKAGTSDLLRRWAAQSNILPTGDRCDPSTTFID